MPRQTLSSVLDLDAAGLLLVEGQPRRLQPKERAALQLFLEHTTGVVSKDEFARRAWATRVMSDESLARLMSRLRALLQPRGLTIEAAYGLGYRLVKLAVRSAVGPGAQALDGHVHARQLMLQRTPAAMALAIDLLRALVREEPGFGSARVSLATALALAMGWGTIATPAAVEEGLAALDGLDDELEGLHAARGGLLDMAWRFEEAGRCFDRAMRVESDRPDTLLALGRHLLYIGDAVPAVEQLQRVRQLAPHSLPVRMMLVRALLQSGRGADAVAEARATAEANPGQLLTMAFALSIRAIVDPQPELEAAALRLTGGLDTPEFAWTIASYVLSRVGRRDAALDIVDTALMCSRMGAGEATLYAAPLAALGEYDRAAALLRAAVDERCGMTAMVLRDPVHAGWLPRHPVGRALWRDVFGPGRA